MTMTPDEEANFLVIREELNEWKSAPHNVEGNATTLQKTQFGGWDFDEPGTIKMRLDFELSKTGYDELNATSGIFETMSLIITQNLTELATHGRRPPQRVDPETGKYPPYTYDPLLSLTDGTVVHGKTLADLTIHETHTYRDFRATKDAYEFTVFMALTFHWAE